MVHNGIEYGMMQAFAEGFGILKAKKEFGLDLSQISHIWQNGSVVRSWLLDLAANALDEDTELKDIKPWVADSGEGRWTVFESIAIAGGVVGRGAGAYDEEREREGGSPGSEGSLAHEGPPGAARAAWRRRRWPLGRRRQRRRRVLGRRVVSAVVRRVIDDGAGRRRRGRCLDHDRNRRRCTWVCT